MVDSSKDMAAATARLYVGPRKRGEHIVGLIDSSTDIVTVTMSLYAGSCKRGCHIMEPSRSMLARAIPTQPLLTLTISLTKELQFKIKTIDSSTNARLTYRAVVLSAQTSHHS